MKSGRFLPIMLLLFVGSGCAALIYEVVWFQLLELVIGSSAVSMGVLLGTFMGGMCLGSLLMPRLLSDRRHPLRVYAGLELGIGVIGLAVLFGMPVVGRLYTAWAGTGAIGILIRGVAAAACLLPPTMLMGATLPAIARWIEARRMALLLLMWWSRRWRSPWPPERRTRRRRSPCQRPSRCRTSGRSTWQSRSPV
jgi:spermidine synthase